MEEKAVNIVQTDVFRKMFTIIGIFFICTTPFISLNPDTFSEFSYLGVFIFNIVSSGLLILPALSAKFNIPLLITTSALGNVLNTSVNYFVGYSSTHIFSHNPLVIKAKKFIKRFGLLAVYILAIVPLPLDVNGLLSGYIGVPYKKYLLVNFLGKITIFFIVCAVVALFFTH
jgi:membrane protein YqaA with SNARE-associated domain